MNSKLKSIFVATFIAGIILIPSKSLADDHKEISAFVNGQQLNFEVSPVIQDGNTLVPFRTIFEKLGFKVNWDSSTQTVSGSKEGLNIQMKIGDKNVVMNGKATTIEVAPTIINGNTLVPLRFVGEANGNEIVWDAANLKIDINSKISVFVDGQQLNFEVSPLIQDGITLVPFRAIFEKFGLEVTWDSSTQTVSGSKEGLNIQMKIGDKNVVMNGKAITIEVAPTIINGNTLVPLRFVGEANGNEIVWDAANRKIEIKNKYVTRAEVSRFLVRSLGIIDQQAKVKLTDVSEDNEYYKEISSAILNGFIAPYTDDGKFGPDNNLTRAEYATMLVKAVNLPTSNNDNNVAIKDINNVPAWAKNYIQAVINAGLMDLYEDGTFRANDLLVINTSQPDIKLKEIKDKIIAEKKASLENDHLLELNKAYKAKDGLTVTVLSIYKAEEAGSIKYSISYKLENETTDKKIDEGTFKMHLENGGNSPQYGFFGSLFPSQSVVKTYAFEVLKQEKPTVIEYGADFFSKTPEIGSLKWRVNP